MKKEDSFSQISKSSVKELGDLLCAERKALMCIRFSKKVGDSKGYEAKFIRKKIARIKTVLSMQKRGC